MKKVALFAGLVVLLVAVSSIASAKTVLTIGFVWDPSYPSSKGVYLAAKIVSEKSKGQMELKVYPASQLGTEEQILDGVLFGSIDIYGGGVGQMGNMFKAINVAEMPYTFKDNDHVIKFGKSEIAKRMFDDMRNEWKVRTIGVTSYGIRHIISKKPIRSPEDLKGFKMRIPEQYMCVEYTKAMGAIPTPIALGEAFIALQTGTVDGIENPLSTFRAMKFYEVAKYISLTSHVVNAMAFLINEAKFQSLTKEEQQILVDAFEEGSKLTVNLLNEEDQQLVGYFKEKGVTVITPDVEAFRVKTAEMPYKFRKFWLRYGEDLHERIMNLK